MDELATIVQSLDGNPSKEEIREMITEVDMDGNGRIDFDEFLSIMDRKMKVINLLDMILRNFQVFEMLRLMN